MPIRSDGIDDGNLGTLHGRGVAALHGWRVQEGVPRVGIVLLLDLDGSLGASGHHEDHEGDLRRSDPFARGRQGNIRTDTT